MAYTTINKSTDHFNTVQWTGNGSTNAITGVGFQPDWVWGKSHTSGYSHQLYDVLRGATYSLKTNGNTVQETLSSGLTSFDSDGFTLGSNTNINASGHTVTGWNWKAGGSGSSNSDGSISSTVSVNSTSKMSIVKWTGTGSNATVGHGLGVAPSVVICKRYSGDTQNWFVFHKGLFDTDNTAYINLNTTDGKSQSSTVFQSTAPTTSVFSTGTGFLASDYIAYCFSDVKGFFKSGVYEGNNSADGTFVYTGFKPAFVLVKRYGANGYSWGINDSKRPGYNETDKYLIPDTTASEQTNAIDLVSNGFKFRSTAGGFNASSSYIYWSFAEAPFVGSNNIVATAR